MARWLTRNCWLAREARGFNIAEEPLTHLPRTAGEATGANLVVIVKAFRDLVRFWLRLNHEIREEKQAYQVSLAVRYYLKSISPQRTRRVRKI